jgi:hypothetical protein
MTFKYVSGGGLLLQRFGKLARACLLGLKQPHVLDRDRGLVGKGLQQVNVPLGEATGLTSGNDDCSNWSVITEHRDRENASPPTSNRDFARVLRISRHVLDLRDRAREDRSARGLVNLWGVVDTFGGGPRPPLAESYDRLRYEAACHRIGAPRPSARRGDALR